jgi:hypothetical protein
VSPDDDGQKVESRGELKLWLEYCDKEVASWNEAGTRRLGGRRSPGSRKADCGSREGKKRSRDPGDAYKVVADNRERDT